MLRLKADKLAMVSLFVVLCYFVVLLLSMTGLVASNWNKEVAVSYAPPSFIGAELNETAKTKASG